MLADKGDLYARRALGVVCDMGQGVPQDYVEAMRCYRGAAERGDALVGE
jgi:TPR repeat protein